MSEPKYDEDLVNLGYLKKAVSNTEENINKEYKNVSRHYGSKPQPPYNKGDTWIDGDIVYVCIKSRQIGTYEDSDWVTESGAKKEAEKKNKIFLRQPSDYSPGDMWILQSDNDHKAGKKGEMLISTAGRAEYDEGDWVNMLGYGTIRSINEVAEGLNNAINRIGNVEEAIEDGIIITFYQETEPEAKHIGDLWYVTGDTEGYTKGKIYRYDGTNWVILDDPAIQKAFDEANEARIVADGKIQSFYSDTEPTKNMGVGDLWIDLANNNQLYRYNGTKWVAVYDTRINELVVNVESVTERVTTVETDLGEIGLKVKETTTTVTTIQGDVTSLEKNVNDIQNNIEEMETNTIYSVDVMYALSDSKTTAPTGEWNTVAPQWQSGKYMWQKTVTTYANGDVSESQPTCISGAQGEAGKDGTSVNILGSYDTIDDLKTEHPTGNIGDSYIIAGDLYVWSGNSSEWKNVGTIQGPKGEQGIQGNAGANGQTSYLHIKYSNDEGNTFTDKNGEEPGDYIGQYVDFVKSDSTDTSKYTWKKIKGEQGIQGLQGIQGQKGETGDTGEKGDTGTGVEEVVEQYYLSTSESTQTGGQWKENQDEWVEGSYIWTRSKVTWTDGSITYTTPVLANAINNANSKASNALDQAENITNTTGQAEGKNIHLTDSAEEPLVDISLHGETKQKTRSGKNLSETNESNNLNTTLCNVESGKTYTISLKINGTLSVNVRINDDGNFANGNYEHMGRFIQATGYQKMTFTPTKSGILYINGFSDTNFTGYSEIMVEEGTKATEYAPYNSLAVKVIGKNLFDKNTDNIINKAFISSGVISAEGASKVFYVKVKPNTTYTFSKIVSYRFRMAEFTDKPVLGSTGINVINKESVTTFTFTTDSTTNYIAVWYYNSGSDTVTEQEILDSIQIELGSTKTEYEPYKSQTATFPLSEGQKLMEGSYLADDGVHNKRKQIVLNGTENWRTITESNLLQFVLDLSSLALSSTTNIQCLSNFYKGSPRGTVMNEDNQISASGAYIRLRDDRYTTVEELKAWLAEQYTKGTPVIIEYELANPETDGKVPYTAEQQEAWDKIKALMTYKNVTNITSEAYAKIVYMRDNGLDVYETKQNASKKYTETSTKLAEQKITVDGIVSEVSNTTSKINELTGELESITAQIAETNLSVEGLGVKVQNKGGNNLFYYDADFWDSTGDFNLEEVTGEVKNNSVSGIGYLVHKGSAYQNVQDIPNGTYTVSFKYKKVGAELASASVKINEEEYSLTATEWTDFVQTIQVNANYIKVEFIADTDNTLYVTDLLGNVGTEKDVWTQNPNETRTDNVKIGKGIQVEDSLYDTYHRIDADGNRTINKKTGEVVNKATDKGSEMKELLVREKAQISGMLIQQVEDQIWLSSLL